MSEWNSKREILLACSLPSDMAHKDLSGCEVNRNQKYSKDTPTFPFPNPLSVRLHQKSSFSCWLELLLLAFVLLFLQAVMIRS